MEKLKCYVCKAEGNSPILHHLGCTAHPRGSLDYGTEHGGVAHPVLADHGEPRPGWHLLLGGQVGKWVVSVFGADVQASRRERVLRLLEEVCELAQAEGVDSTTAEALVSRVWSRPAEPAETELADVVFTLLAYADSTGQDIQRAGEQAMGKALALDPERLRRKHQGKAADGVTDPDIVDMRGQPMTERDLLDVLDEVQGHKS